MFLDLMEELGIQSQVGDARFGNIESRFMTAAMRTGF
jgi:hypothetical protein